MVKSISQPSSNQATVEALVSSKKLYFLKDPVTGKYWTERDSKRVNPMFYPQQVGYLHYFHQPKHNYLSIYRIHLLLGTVIPWN